MARILPAAVDGSGYRPRPIDLVPHVIHSAVIPAPVGDSIGDGWSSPNHAISTTRVTRSLNRSLLRLPRGGLRGATCDRERTPLFAIAGTLAVQSDTTSIGDRQPWLTSSPASPIAGKPHRWQAPSLAIPVAGVELNVALHSLPKARRRPKFAANRKDSPSDDPVAPLRLAWRVPQ
jgi:hypothetical protein